VTFRLTQISDTHLSAKRAWAAPNFEAVVRHLAANPPDLIVNTGDVVLDDPDDDEDVAYAYGLHQQLPAPWLVIPGNHDVGDNGAEPWQDEPPTPARLERFVERWGADRFSIDLDGWRIIGANNLLVGTGLAAEKEQADWLRQHLHGHDRVALFVHKPICLTHPLADDGLGGPLELPARLRFWSILEGSGVRLVASGHLHRSKAGTLPGGIETVWAPATSFLGRDRADGAVRRAGIVEYEFDGDTVRYRMVIPDGMRDFEIGGIMETYGSLRFAPEAPVEA
jgi:3',5'-cyclic AMP phosphodiesterase CpdA